MKNIKPPRNIKNFISKFHKIETHDLGLFSENIIMFFLWIKGYIILKHRFKYNDILGDIDIIAVSRKFIVFIEVKSSKKKINQEKVLNDPQINRMIEISDYFLLKNEKFRNFKKRYDYIEIKRFLYVFFTIKHYKNFIS